MSAPLLICSIGNPGAQYASTLHSAGHVVLSALRTALQCPPFQKDKSLANGSVSHLYSLPSWTLWQSPLYMNESGKAVRKAWDVWSRANAGGRLVVVHDELERPLGSVRVVTGNLSPRGHNGLKSIIQHMGGVGFVRVGVGIGRPVSRDPNDVASFVLKKMTPAEKMKVEGSVNEVVEVLRRLGNG